MLDGEEGLSQDLLSEQKHFLFLWSIPRMDRQPPVLGVLHYASQPTLLPFLLDSVPGEIEFGTVSTGLPGPLAFIWGWTTEVLLQN